MRAPRHLKAATRRWVESVESEFLLEPHHRKLLIMAAESWDRACQARKELEAHGSLTVVSKSGDLRAHPCVAIERDSQIRYARLLRELQLDISMPAEPASRPPGLHPVIKEA